MNTFKQIFKSTKRIQLGDYLILKEPNGKEFRIQVEGFEKENLFVFSVNPVLISGISMKKFSLKYYKVLKVIPKDIDILDKAFGVEEEI